MNPLSAERHVFCIKILTKTATNGSEIRINQWIIKN